MFKSLEVKLGIFTFFLTSALLIALPRIYFTIENKMLFLDSFIGGYVVEIGEEDKKVFDWYYYNTPYNFFQGTRLELNFADDSVNEDQYKETVNILGARLNYVTPQAFSIKESESFSGVAVDFTDTRNVNNNIMLLARSGNANFKELEPSFEFLPNRLEEAFNATDSWVDAGIDKNHYVQATVNKISSDAGEIPQITLNLTEEGNQRFLDLLSRNVDRPIGFFINDEPLPVSMPTVSREIYENFSGFPVFQGMFDVELIPHVSALLNTPNLNVEISSGDFVSYPIIHDLRPVIYVFYGFLFALFLILVLYLMVFNINGLFGLMSNLFYIIFALAFFKIFQVRVNLQSIGAFVLLLMFSNYFFYSILSSARDMSVKNAYQKHAKNVMYACGAIIFISLFFMQFYGSDFMPFIQTLLFSTVSFYASYLGLQFFLEGFQFLD